MMYNIGNATTECIHNQSLIIQGKIKVPNVVLGTVDISNLNGNTNYLPIRKLYLQLSILKQVY